MVRHECIYCTVLGILSVSCLCGIGLLAAIMALPAGARPPMMWPEWALPLLAFVNGMYFAAAIVTLVLRRVEPGAGRRLTRAFNIALLFGPPIGTIIGLYGLWKVDRTSGPPVVAV